MNFCFVTLHRCLDEAAESAFLPSFCGDICESSISGQYPEQFHCDISSILPFGCYITWLTD
jgi:hypothetical protein